MMRLRLPTSYKRTAFALLATLAIAFAPTASAEKYASIVVNIQTNEVLHARHADDARYPASLTKVMTLYMLYDALKAGEITLDEKLPVSRFAAAQAPSNLKLRSGSTIRVADAIDALITKSANDVAVVVAERIGGSEKRFARLMTVKAKSLGMKNTRFMNASGLPNSKQTSTARDMAILAEAMLDNHRDYYHWFSQKEFKWKGRTYKTHNGLLNKVDGVDGIKTGYTRASGFNLMTSAERNGQRIVTIMLGGRTSNSRNAHVTALVEAAFASLEEKALANGTADQPQAFARIGQPLDPDAAAEPMLNGQPLSAIIAQGDIDGEDTPSPLQAAVSDAPTATAAIEIAAQTVAKEAEIAIETAVDAAQPAAEVVTQPTEAPATEIVQIEPAPAETVEAPTPKATPSLRPTMSVAEYEARQLRGRK
jgi:D-alanyl-D-alanine carboxypeptidase